MTHKSLLKILFIEDLPSDVDLAVLELQKEKLKFEHTTVCTRVDLIKALNEFNPDLIISDYMMPAFNGLQALKEVKEFNPGIPFILCTGSINEETAVECIKAGADDYVIKEHLTRLPFAAKEALEQHRIQIEKRAAELLLKENEEKLQSIFSAAPVGIGLLVNGILIEANDTFCEMTGYDRKELIGTNGNVIFPTIEEYEFVENESNRQIAERGSVALETRLKSKNGNILNILLSTAPLNQNDLSRGLTFTVLDITERKQAEEALQQSQHLFQTLTQVSPVGIFRTDPDGNTTYVNPKWSELSGLSLEEAYGIGWLNAVHPDDREKLSESWINNLKSRNESSAEYRFLKPDGSIVWLMGKAVPELIGNEVTGYIGTITDITERKWAEDALWESEVRYKTLFSNTAEGILVAKNETKQFLYANPALCKMFGYTEKELMRLGVKDIHPKESLDYVLAEFKAQMQGEKTLASDLPCLRKDGTLFYADIRSTSMVLDGFQCNVGFFIDITEHKLAEAKLQETNEYLTNLFNHANAPIIVWDISLCITRFNNAFEHLSGYGAEEVIGKKVDVLFPKEKIESSLDLIRRALSGELWENVEIEIQRKDGDSRIVLWNSANILDKDGKTIVATIAQGNDITRRKQVEEVLRESESSLRNAQEIAKMGNWEWDIVAQKTHWSDNYFTIHGYKPDEVEPSFELFRNRIHPDDVHLLDEKHAIIMKDKTPSSFELRLTRPDGTVKWIQNNISPVVEDDKLVKLKGVIIDITERKRAEDKLRSSEERLKILFDYAPDAYYLNDLRGNFIDGNIAAEKLLGHDKNELIGKSFLKLNLLSLKQLPRAAKLLVKNALGQGTGPDEFELCRKDGSKVNVEIITHPVKIKDKTLVLGLARDISERKRAEETLRESEEKYRRIFENVLDVFYELSIRGKILEASPSIELLSKGQYKRDDLIGKSMYDFYPDPTERRTLLNVLREREFISDFEINLKNRDGSSIPCSVSAKIIFDADKRPEKIIGSMHDITDRKNAIEALKLAKEKAEASDKLKTTFLNNISHEVRTPLNGILGFAEIMSDTDLSEEEKKVSLSMLFESSDRLLNTITNYMDISLITSGTMSLYKKDFLPGQVLREKLAKYKIMCSIKNLDLSLKIPEKGEEISIHSDPEILRKIMAHLLNNAIKFTEKGSIDFGYEINRNELEFFVKDTGIGIGKESLKDVFEHFVKEDRGPLKITEGSGLGLSISKGLVELMGGKIRVESEKGQGSTFFFTVPVDKEFENYIISPPISKQKRNKTTNSILVAEDDETNFFYLKALLKPNTSAEIIHASNGKEAVDKFMQNSDIGLILMDIKMPVMDGLEATRQIKAINRDIPVIAITAYAMAGDEARILDAGCDYYLVKPINKKLLLDKMAEFIEI